MKHQPYENWILEDIELTDEQFAEMDMHMETCADCSTLQKNLGAALSFIQVAPMVEPSPGFAQRWLKSVDARKAIQQKLLIRRVLLFLGVSFIATLTILLGISALTSSPISILLQGIRSLAGYYGNFIQFKGIALAFIRALPPVIPVFFWVLITSTLSAISLFWVFAMWRLSTQKAQVLKK